MRASIFVFLAALVALPALAVPFLQVDRVLFHAATEPLSFGTGLGAYLGTLQTATGLQDLSVPEAVSLSNGAAAEVVEFVATVAPLHPAVRAKLGTLLGDEIARVADEALDAAVETGRLTLVDELPDGVGRLSVEANEVGGLTVADLKPPRGITVEGALHRSSADAHVDTAWETGWWNLQADHRYSRSGEAAVYGGTTRETAHAEILQYVTDLGGRTDVKLEVRVENVLDLTDAGVRSGLGVSLTDITTQGSAGYAIPQTIGTWARAMGYQGLLVPSAAAPGGENLVIFR